MRRKKILVVEDNLINQKVASKLLLAFGYQADIADDGAKALQLLQSGVYQAVLMDIQMPVMDGLETTRAIRRLDGEARQIPIVALTANAYPEARQKCLAAGMNDFLTKPIEKDKFAAALARWTNGGAEDQLLIA